MPVYPALFPKARLLASLLLGGSLMLLPAAAAAETAVSAPVARAAADKPPQALDLTGGSHGFYHSETINAEAGKCYAFYVPTAAHVLLVGSYDMIGNAFEAATVSWLKAGGRDELPLERVSENGEVLANPGLLPAGWYVFEVEKAGRMTVTLNLPDQDSAASASAGQPLPISAATGDETLHQELRALRDTMQSALNQRDLDTLLQHVTDDVVFTTMNGDRVTGKDGIRQYFDKMLNGDQAVVKSVTTQFEVAALSHLYGGDTAVAFGDSTDQYVLNSGDAWEVKPQWSATLVRQDGRWLIANFHYSVNMFDNPILGAQRTLLLGSAAGGIVGALGVGFWLGRRRRK